MGDQFKISKCCVGGCNATSNTHRLFSFPKYDHLRNLWMAFLVPTNSLLIGLNKERLLRKRVCEQHFDSEQFDGAGRRLRYSYPCLFTNAEITHGIPLCGSEWNVKLEHNYSKEQDMEDDTELMPLFEDIDLPWEHNYSKEVNPTSKYYPKKLLQEKSHDKQSLVMFEFIDVGSCHEQPSCSYLPAVASIMKNKGITVKKFESKEKFMEQATQIATDSMGDSSSQRLAEAQTMATDEELLDKFNLLDKQAKTFLLMQLKQCEKVKWPEDLL